jgi:hypothetical protein
MAMGAKFNDPLVFQPNGELEVCGPVSFGLDDVFFEVTAFTITDGKGVSVHHQCNPPVRARFGEMWESDLEPDDASKLTPGSGGRGEAHGRMHKRDGSIQQFPWSQRLSIV